MRNISEKYTQKKRVQRRGGRRDYKKCQRDGVLAMSRNEKDTHVNKE